MLTLRGLLSREWEGEGGGGGLGGDPDWLDDRMME